MKNEVSIPIPHSTPRVTEVMNCNQVREHRAGIASEVRVILSAYFQPNEPNDIRDAQLAWWCDELQDWTREQVVYALRHWNREKPRLRPTPGDIVSLLKKLRGEREAERMKSNAPPEPEKPKGRVSAEQASEILKQAGFAVRRFGGDE